MKAFTTTVFFFVSLHDGHNLYAGAEHLRGNDAYMKKESPLAQEETYLCANRKLQESFTYVLKNLSTDFVLDSNGNGDAYTKSQHGGDYQKWMLINSDIDGFYGIMNLATGLVLDGNGHGDVRTNTFNGGSYQKWEKNNVDGNYVIQNLATGNVLDSNAHGNVYAKDSNGGSYQKWPLN